MFIFDEEEEDNLKKAEESEKAKEVVAGDTDQTSQQTVKKSIFDDNVGIKESSQQAAAPTTEKKKKSALDDSVGVTVTAPTAQRPATDQTTTRQVPIPTVREVRITQPAGTGLPTGPASIQVVEGAELLGNIRVRPNAPEFEVQQSNNYAGLIRGLVSSEQTATTSVTNSVIARMQNSNSARNTAAIVFKGITYRVDPDLASKMMGGNTMLQVGPRTKPDANAIADFINQQYNKTYSELSFAHQQQYRDSQQEFRTRYNTITAKDPAKLSKEDKQYLDWYNANMATKIKNLPESQVKIKVGVESVDDNTGRQVSRQVRFTEGEDGVPNGVEFFSNIWLDVTELENLTGDEFTKGYSRALTSALNLSGDEAALFASFYPSYSSSSTGEQLTNFEVLSTTTEVVRQGDRAFHSFIDNEDLPFLVQYARNYKKKNGALPTVEQLRNTASGVRRVEELTGTSTEVGELFKASKENSWSPFFSVSMGGQSPLGLTLRDKSTENTIGRNLSMIGSSNAAGVYYNKSKAAAGSPRYELAEKMGALTNCDDNYKIFYSTGGPGASHTTTRVCEIAPEFQDQIEDRLVTTYRQQRQQIGQAARGYSLGAYNPEASPLTKGGVGLTNIVQNFAPPAIIIGTSFIPYAGPAISTSLGLIYADAVTKDADATTRTLVMGSAFLGPLVGRAGAAAAGATVAGKTISPLAVAYIQGGYGITNSVVMNTHMALNEGAFRDLNGDPLVAEFAMNLVLDVFGLSMDYKTVRAALTQSKFAQDGMKAGFFSRTRADGTKEYYSVKTDPKTYTPKLELISKQDMETAAREFQSNLDSLPDDSPYKNQKVPVMEITDIQFDGLQRLFNPKLAERLQQAFFGRSLNESRDVSRLLLNSVVSLADPAAQGRINLDMTRLDENGNLRMVNFDDYRNAPRIGENEGFDNEVYQYKKSMILAVLSERGEISILSNLMDTFTVEAIKRLEAEGLVQIAGKRKDGDRRLVLTGKGLQKAEEYKVDLDGADTEFNNAVQEALTNPDKFEGLKDQSFMDWADGQKLESGLTGTQFILALTSPRADSSNSLSAPAFTLSSLNFRALPDDQKNIILAALSKGIIVQRPSDGALVNADYVAKIGFEEGVTKDISFGNTEGGRREQMLYLLGERALSGEDNGVDVRETIDTIKKFYLNDKLTDGDIIELGKKKFEFYRNQAIESGTEGSTIRVNLELTSGYKEVSDSIIARTAAEQPAETEAPTTPRPVPAQAEQQQSDFVSQIKSIIEGEDIGGRISETPIEKLPIADFKWTKAEETETLPSEFVVMSSGRRPSYRIFRTDEETGLIQEFSVSPNGKLTKVGDLRTEQSIKLDPTISKKMIGTRPTWSRSQLVDINLGRVNDIFEDGAAIDPTIRVMKSTPEQNRQTLLSVAQKKGEVRFGPLAGEASQFKENSDVNVLYDKDANATSAVVNEKALRTLLQTLNNDSFTRAIHQGYKPSSAGLTLGRGEIGLILANLDRLSPAYMSKLGLNSDEVASIRTLLNDMLSTGNFAFAFGKLNVDRIKGVSDYFNAMESNVHEFRHALLVNWKEGALNFVGPELGRISKTEHWAAVREKAKQNKDYRNISDVVLAQEIMAYGSNLDTLSNFYGKPASEITAEDIDNFALAYKDLVKNLKDSGAPQDVLDKITRTEDPRIQRLIAEDKNYVNQTDRPDTTRQAEDITGRETTGTGRGGGVPKDSEGTPKYSEPASADEPLRGTGTRQVVVRSFTSSGKRITPTAPVQAESEVRPTLDVISRKPDGQWTANEPGWTSMETSIALFNLVDLAQHPEAAGVVATSPTNVWHRWLSDNGYEGFFNSSSGLGEDVNYRISLLDTPDVRRKLTEGKVSQVILDQENLGGTLRMSSNPILMSEAVRDNLVLSADDIEASNKAWQSGSGIYKLSNSEAINLDINRNWDATSSFTFKHDRGTLNLYHLNNRGLEALLLLTAKPGDILSDDSIAMVNAIFGITLHDSPEVYARKTAKQLNTLETSKEYPYISIMDGIDEIKQFLGHLANTTYDKLLAPQDPAATAYQTNLNTGRTMLLRHSPLMTAQETQVTRLHEGTHALIYKYYPTDRALFSALLSNSPTLNIRMRDFAELYSSDSSGYAARYNELRAKRDYVTAHSEMYHEILAHGTSMRDLDNIGIDINNEVHVRTFLDAYTGILETITNTSGEPTAKDLSKYLDPELTQIINEIYPDKNKNQSLFGPARLEALQEIGKRQISATSVRENEEGLPPGPAALRTSSPPRTESDVITSRATIPGVKVNGIDLNSADVPWQLRHAFKQLVEGGHGSIKVTFAPENYDRIAARIIERLKFGVTASREFLADMEARTPKMDARRGVVNWYDEAAILEPTGTIRLKSPFAWSKYLRDLDGAKFETKEAAKEAIYPALINYARGQVNEFETALRWAEKNGISLDHEEVVLKMSSFDEEYQSQALQRMSELALIKTAADTAFVVLTEPTSAQRFYGDRGFTLLNTDETRAATRGKILLNGIEITDDSIPAHIRFSLNAYGVDLRNFNYEDFKNVTTKRLELKKADREEELNAQLARFESEPVQVTETSRSSVAWFRPYVGDVVTSKETGLVTIRTTNDPYFRELNGREVATQEEGIQLLQDAYRSKAQDELAEFDAAINWVSKDFTITEVMPNNLNLMRESGAIPRRAPSNITKDEANDPRLARIAAEFEYEPDVMTPEVFTALRMSENARLNVGTELVTNRLADATDTVLSGEGVFTGRPGKAYLTVDQSQMDGILANGVVRFGGTNELVWTKGEGFSGAPGPRQFILEVDANKVDGITGSIRLSELSSVNRFALGDWVDSTQDALADSHAVNNHPLMMSERPNEDVKALISDPVTGFYDPTLLPLFGFDPLDSSKPYTKLIKTEKTSGEQWYNLLRGVQGVKEINLYWGIGTWLLEPQNIRRSITLAELRDAALKYSVKVDRTILSDSFGIKVRWGLYGEPEEVTIGDIPPAIRQKYQEEIDSLAPMIERVLELSGESGVLSQQKQQIMESVTRAMEGTGPDITVEQLTKMEDDIDVKYFSINAEIRSLSQKIGLITDKVNNEVGISRDVRYTPIGDYRRYVTPGPFTDYHEVLLSFKNLVPGRTGFELTEELLPAGVSIIKDSDDNGEVTYRLEGPGTELYENLEFYSVEDAVYNFTLNLYPTYENPHFSAKNNTTHLRGTIRSAGGKKLYEMTEVQSDHSQALFGKDSYSAKDYARYTELRDSEFVYDSPLTAAERAEFNRLSDLINDEGMPEAPLSTVWYEVGVKSALRLAIEANADEFVWTTGFIQTERYSGALKSTVDKIEYKYVDDEGNNLKKAITDWENTKKYHLSEFERISTSNLGLDRLDGLKKSIEKANEKIEELKQRLSDYQSGGVKPSVEVIAYKGGDRIFKNIFPDGGKGTVMISRYGDEDLPVTIKGLFGSSIEKQIIANKQGGVIEGDDITMGGEFYKDLYDNKVVKAVAKIMSKYGVKPERKPLAFAGTDVLLSQEFDLNSQSSVAGGKYLDNILLLVNSRNKFESDRARGLQVDVNVKMSSGKTVTDLDEVADIYNRLYDEFRREAKKISNERKISVGAVREFEIISKINPDLLPVKAEVKRTYIEGVSSIETFKVTPKTLVDVADSLSELAGRQKDSGLYAETVIKYSDGSEKIFQGKVKDAEDEIDRYYEMYGEGTLNKDSVIPTEVNVRFSTSAIEMWSVPIPKGLKDQFNEGVSLYMSNSPELVDTNMLKVNQANSLPETIARENSRIYAMKSEELTSADVNHLLDSANKTNFVVFNYRQPWMDDAQAAAALDRAKADLDAKGIKYIEIDGTWYGEVTRSLLAYDPRETAIQWVTENAIKNEGQEATVESINGVGRLVMNDGTELISSGRATKEYSEQDAKQFLDDARNNPADDQYNGSIAPGKGGSTFMQETFDTDPVPTTRTPLTEAEIQALETPYSPEAKLLMSDPRFEQNEAQRVLNESEEKLQAGDEEAWIELASRTVQGGILADSEMQAIRRMAASKDKDALHKYITGLSYISPVELVANLGRVGLLMGFRNIAKNVAGNSLRQFMDEMSRIPASLMDILLIQVNKAMGGTNLNRSVTGLLTDPEAVLEAYKMAFSQGLSEGFQESWNVLKGNNEQAIFEHPALFREKSTGWRFLKPLEIIEKYGWRFQGALDRPFNTVAYYRALAEIQSLHQKEQARLGNKISFAAAEGYLTPLDVETARYRALAATFQENNPIASKYYELVDGLPAFWRSMINSITKFVKTPLNVMDYVLDYTGFWPIAKLAVKEYNTQDWVDWKRSVRNIFDNPVDRRILSMAISQGSFGTMMLYIGSKMAEAGILSAFFRREEKKESEQMEAKGTSWGEVIINGKSIDISWLSPNAFYLISGATMYETQKDWYDKKSKLEGELEAAKLTGDTNKIETAEQALSKHIKKSPGEQMYTRILKNFALQTPFLRQGLDIATALEQDNFISGLAQKWYSPEVLVPAIVKEIAMTMDSYDRVVTDESVLGKMRDRIQKNIPTIPGLESVGKAIEGTGIPFVSGFGKILTGRENLPIKHDMFGRPIPSPTGVDPFKSKGLDISPLVAEMDKYDVSIPVPKGATSIDVDRRTKEKGEFFTPFLQSVIDSAEYKSADDATKKSILDSSIRYISDEYRERKKTKEELQHNLRTLAFRESFKNRLRNSPAEFFSESSVTSRNTINALSSLGIRGQVSFEVVISDLASDGGLDKFINEKFNSSYMVGSKVSLKKATTGLEKLQQNPTETLVEWWANSQRDKQSRERNDARRQELLDSGLSEEQVARIMRKESSRRSAVTRRQNKGIKSVDIVR